MTAQGSPRARFRRAIERGSVFQAEAAAREFGLSLEEALQLVLLYAAYEPAKLERAALRWFVRYLDEGKGVSLLNAQLALSALAELRGGDREAAEELLRAGAAVDAARTRSPPSVLPDRRRESD